MSKFTIKIALPIILVGLFSIIVFFASGYGQLGLGFYAIIIFLAIYIFFFGLAIGQSLSSPVKKLLNRATELSEGNLSGRLYLETKDEFAELAKIFNKIAERMEEGKHLEENSEKTINIKVQARTKELEETITALEQKVKNRTAELEKLLKESRRLQECARVKTEAVEGDSPDNIENKE